MLDEEGEDKDEMDVGVRREEVKRDTSHAPDLLEGPSINQNSKCIASQTGKCGACAELNKPE